MKLHDINKAFDELIKKAINPETGEIAPEFEDQLNKLNLTKAEKLLNYALIIKNKNIFKKSIVTERKRMQSKEKTLETSIDWLKFILKRELAGEKITDPRVSVYYQSRNSVEIDDNFNPEEYYESGNANGLVNRNVGYTISKTRIAEKIETGLSLAWAKIVTKTSMAVR